MFEEDIKILEFRDELIKLLKKYNYTLEGHTDNEEMIINNFSSNYYYIIKGELSNYSTDRCNLEEPNVNLMEQYILNSVKGFKRNEFCIGNHININCGIVTDDEFKARYLFNKFYEENKSEVSRYINGIEHKRIKLKNNYTYVWIRPSLGARGYRCQSIYIDKNISKEVFDECVLPIFCLYADEKDIKVF